METVAAPARNLLGAGGVTFVLREEGDLCFYAEEDAISPLWKGKRFPMDACISGWSMREAKAVAIADIYKDSRIPHDAYRPTFVKSLAMVPVPQDQPIAAMGAYWPEVGEPSSDALHLLQAIGNAAALAIGKVTAQQDRAKQSALQSELSRRIKNVFALMQALINQTRGESVEEYRRTLNRRIETLAPAYAEIYGQERAGVDLESLIECILSPLSPVGNKRLDLAGPQVALPAYVTTHLGLIISELGTNAVKHGALSVETGTVRVRWERHQDGLRFFWWELDGPPAQEPTEEGFGTRLLHGEASYSLDGDLQLRY